LDEPTSGDLDPGSFIKIISSLKSPEMENMAMVITTSSPSVATLEGATAYYFVGGVLFRRAELTKVHSPEVEDYLTQIKRYTERQRKDIPPFFADADSKGMGGTL
jgi:ABC-type multidrug transport system ATPase subunit